MDSVVITVIVLAMIAAALGVWMFARKRTSEHLRGRFGPEYDHAVHAHGDTVEAEAELSRREQRVRQFQIRPLTESDQRFYMESWQRCQARFVDDPPAAIEEADRIVCDVMKARGYPMSDFDNRAADLSVDYPHVVRHYRAGHDLAEKVHHGSATTEELRTAMVHFRELFNELVTPSHSPEPAHHR